MPQAAAQLSGRAKDRWRTSSRISVRTAPSFQRIFGACSTSPAPSCEDTRAPVGGPSPALPTDNAVCFCSGTNHSSLLKLLILVGVPHSVEQLHHLSVHAHGDRDLAADTSQPRRDSAVQSRDALVPEDLVHAVHRTGVLVSFQALHAGLDDVDALEGEDAHSAGEGAAASGTHRGRSPLLGDGVEHPEARGLGGADLQDSWQDATVELREAFILGDGVHAVEKAVVLWVLREKLVVNELDLDRLLRSGHKNALHRARAKASHETLRFSEAKAVASVLIDQKA
mmetsp:Transcript_19988/g.75480  ORF Transcript_19988/g.75480 Transcript_19988/m.75480 type:complete len:283 (+) Transcript_19988:956-1804(+)